MRSRWLLSALAGVRAARLHIAEENPQAAAAVADKIEQSVQRLAKFPNSGRPGTVAGTREVVIPGLPYLLVYRVSGDEIQVLRLFHQKQNRIQAGKGDDSRIVHTAASPPRRSK